MSDESKLNRRKSTRASFTALATPFSNETDNPKVGDLRTRKIRVENTRLLLFVALLVSSVSFLCVVLLQSHVDTNEKNETLQNNVVVTTMESPEPVVTTEPVLFENYSFHTTHDVRNAFYERYGGERAALALLERGLRRHGSSTATARRLLHAAAHSQPFVMAFAGYSVTVGRGNYFLQSFPFVVERLLRPVLQSSLSLPLVVRNSAIGGVPSFPYGWCLPHFVGRDASVTSWDYGMNEGRGAAVLESYVRHALMLPHRPLVIVVESTQHARCQLLHEYAKQGLLEDAVCLSRATQEVLDPEWWQRPDAERPVGLQRWEQFGAPETCPGRSSWHPKKQEHELMGWLLAMYFVDAIDAAVSLQAADPNWRESYTSSQQLSKPILFPKVSSSIRDHAMTQLLYGHLVNNDNDDHQMQNTEHYRMAPLSCRTNFLPAWDAAKVLPSIIVDGLSTLATVDDILEERSDKAYLWGWVLDVSKIERDTKRKVQACAKNGLGYIDMKVALYGLPQSGTLRLWLPLEKSSGAAAEEGDGENLNLAKYWFSSLIVCEANEKRPAGACELDLDIHYSVGGLLVQKVNLVRGVAEYLNRPTCVRIEIPEEARITRLSQVRTATGKTLSAKAKQRLLEGSGGAGEVNDPVGLVVDLLAKKHVNRKAGACCISHVIWEQL